MGNRATALAMLCLLASGTLPVAAQGAVKAAAEPGAVEGDIYLVFMNGESKQGVGQQVYLLPLNTTTYVARQEVCAKRDIHFKALRAAHDSALKPLSDSVYGAEPELRAAMAERRKPTFTFDWSEVMARLQALQKAQNKEQDDFYDAMRDTLVGMVRTHAIARTSSGMHAHFRFEEVAPGPYMIFASWNINGAWRQMWGVAEVKPGKVTKRDLDTSGAPRGWGC